MANLIQLDVAAKLVGKSEVTIRRLIKAGKLHAHKEKTLTGFIYQVDADVVKAYYAQKSAPLLRQHSEPEYEDDNAPVHTVKNNGKVKVAVSGHSGDPSAYWARRAEVYEERYTQAIEKNGALREELGLWRGRAEHAQALLVKLLPAPSTVEIKESATPIHQPRKKRHLSFTGVMIVVAIPVLALVGGALAFLLLHYNP